MKRSELLEHNARMLNTGGLITFTRAYHPLPIEEWENGLIIKVKNNYLDVLYSINEVVILDIDKYKVLNVKYSDVECPEKILDHEPAILVYIPQVGYTIFPARANYIFCPDFNRPLNQETEEDTFLPIKDYYEGLAEFLMEEFEIGYDEDKGLVDEINSRAYPEDTKNELKMGTHLKTLDLQRKAIQDAYQKFTDSVAEFRDALKEFTAQADLNDEDED